MSHFAHWTHYHRHYSNRCYERNVLRPEDHRRERKCEGVKRTLVTLLSGRQHVPSAEPTGVVTDRSGSCLPRFFVVPGCLLVCYDAFCKGQSTSIVCVCLYSVRSVPPDNWVTSSTEQSPSWEANTPQLVKKSPAFTSVRHLFLS